MTDELSLKVEAYIAEVNKLRDLTDVFYKDVVMHPDVMDTSVDPQIKQLLFALDDAVRYVSGVGL